MANTTVKSGGPRCTICDHPKRDLIDKDLALNHASVRTIASRFQVSYASVQRHRTKHLSARVESLAVAASSRAEKRSADAFFADVSAIREAAFQFLKDAPKARKSIRLGKETWEERRDLMPMGAAIEKATRITEVYGRAIGVLGENAEPQASRAPVQLIVPMFLQVGVVAPAAVAAGVPVPGLNASARQALESPAVVDVEATEARDDAREDGAEP